jgi:dephospho-CoA kinase
MPLPLRIGLTGGIASGKSTVARLFEALGVPVIDTDQLAREVVEPGEPALAAVVEGFGPGVLAADGRLDRRALRARVFADPVARERLEAILHPAIRAALAGRSADAGGPYQVWVIPLLVEGGQVDRVDRVLVVDCPAEVQLARLIGRDGETPDSARAILAAQATRGQRLAVADDVIVNDGSEAALPPQVAALDAKYRELCSGSGPGGLRAGTPAAE